MIAASNQILTRLIVTLGVSLACTSIYAQSTNATTGYQGDLADDAYGRYAETDSSPVSIVDTLMTPNREYENPPASIVQRHSVQVVAPSVNRPESQHARSESSRRFEAGRPDVVNRMRNSGDVFQDQRVVHASAEMRRQDSRQIQSVGFEMAQEYSGNNSSPKDAQWLQDLNSRMAAADSVENSHLLDQSSPAYSESFIDRERAAESEQPNATRDLMTKIGINLMFVLAIAFGALLMIKNWQKSRFPKLASKSESQELNVSQILPLSNGATLHVVDGMQNRFVVAIDSTGIKSVNVLNPSFDDVMQFAEERETRSQRSQRRQSASARGNAIEAESSSDIDQNLINLLLRSAKQAA
ncbi:hypothetical protein [Stieleria varia]|uniref:Flagellar biosynthesis protein, FliO n=1 Tax=Stieleria varia TaxID=2528005 RepID=A0A5C6ASW0_9BACT|nr:hypothetical protein [Stieleria varia]TWU02369.1 hypothetical protein Pla52n_34190 [Stieleria varia]